MAGACLRRSVRCVGIANRKDVPMQSPVSRTLVSERSQELRRAADRALLAARYVANKQPLRRPDRIASLRARVARLTARSAERES